LNTSDFFLPYDNKILALSIVNHSDVRDCLLFGFCGIEIDLKMSYFSEDYFAISNVRNIPEKPLENADVTIAWETTLDGDSTIHWRYASIASNLSDLNFTGWTSKYSNSSVYEHQIVINGSSIVANMFYQYWVESNRSGTVLNATNGGVYYNFSVFGVGLPDYTNQTMIDQNLTAPMIRTALDHLEAATGIDAFAILNGLAIFITIFLAALGGIATQKAELAIGILITCLLVFSVIGWLPSYVFVFITVVFSIAMSVIIRRVIT
jgi:hypothetical protein